ncbi:hypothetical protein EHI47_07225 [Rhizobium leguminosarum]|uniref:Uncharacterized protein n=1 Tax=Rhizobium leguminosarum TaxID=384 RepID=A0A444I7S9_RHILE|nr:hypothetical protein [Rhizobium leguminosarum]RWX34183.1 hypothetical protein EHI47_07225 [Rhizobium leguminosarum]
MFKIIHTMFSESQDQMNMALRVENPLTGMRYTFRLGLTRDTLSRLDDVEAYSRRVEGYRRSIELSANP